MISASGVPGSIEGSGEAEGSGVGNGGGARSGAEERLFFTGALFLFRGEVALLEGDSGSICALCSGSKISEGSILSVGMLFFVRPPVRGVRGTVVVVFRLAGADFRGLRFGAGVKSSSLSSSTFVSTCSSSSSESTTTFRRVVARLEGLTGDPEDILDPTLCI